MVILICIPINAKLVQYVYCDSVRQAYEADVVVRKADPDIFTVTIVTYKNGVLVKYVVTITKKTLYYNRRIYYCAIDADETEYGARLHDGFSILLKTSIMVWREAIYQFSQNNER